MGSVTDDAEAVASHLRKQGKRVRVVSVKLLHPFPEADVIRALQGKKAVTVLERSGTTALTQLVNQALYRSYENHHTERLPGIPGLSELPSVSTAIFGLGGHYLQPRHLVAAFENMISARNVPLYYLGSKFFSDSTSPEMNALQEQLKKAYTEQALAPAEILEKTELAEGIVEFRVHAPLITRAALAGQFVRVLLSQDGEFIPLTLADWDVRQGNIDLVIQGVGTSTKLMNQLEPQQSFAGIAGPLGSPSVIKRYDNDRRVVFIAGGVGLPPVLPILKEHLELGNQTVLISGFRNLTQAFWHEPGQRLDRLQSDFPNLEVIYTSDDGSFGLHGLVTQPLETMLKQANTLGPGIGEVIAIGPPLMMRAVSELTRPYGVKTIASLNSVMIDATGMCGACMVPIHKEDQLLRKHACVDGPEFDAHSIDWEKLLPRFKQFNLQELRSQELKGLS